MASQANIVRRRRSGLALTETLAPSPVRASPDIRRAHSLIEMLVVLIIVGILIAIAVPAIQRARESARQAQCVHNQGQLVKAVHMHIADEPYGRFPGYRAFAADGATTIGWAPQVFEYLGRNDLPADPTQATYVELLACPSDQGPTNQPRLNYVVNGGQPDVDSPADGIFFDHAKNDRVYITKDDFRDGLGNTIMLAENIDATNWNVTDEANQCILWPLTAGNEINSGVGARPSSHHPGGFVAAFADGSVKFMAESDINTDTAVHTDQSLYVALLTPGGDDVIPGGGAGTDTSSDPCEGGILGTGQYVRVRRNTTSPQPWMILIEVEVFDQSGTNVALGKTVTSHSTDGRWNMPPEESVDGLAAGYQNVNANYNGLHTNDTASPKAYPWMVIDLGTPTNISRIKVWNRCCDGYQWENIPGTVIEIYDQDPTLCELCPASLGNEPLPGFVWSMEAGDEGVPTDEQELLAIGHAWDLPPCE